MKKIIVFLLALLLITGCEIGTDMSNTPTKRVENYLDSYQSLDDNILNDLDTLLVDLDYTVEQKDSYRELMKNHYQNLMICQHYLYLKLLRKIHEDGEFRYHQI